MYTGTDVPPTPIMTVETAFETGVSRARWYAERYGITSPQVMDCLHRWASIMDDLAEMPGKLAA